MGAEDRRPACIAWPASPPITQWPSSSVFVAAVRERSWIDCYEALEPHSHVDGCINFMAEDDQGRVKDNFKRIKTIARLSSPFVQLVPGFPKTHGGTALGLALIRLIAGAQGGRIEVRSELGQGSTFTVTLPRAPGAALKYRSAHGWLRRYSHSRGGFAASGRTSRISLMGR